MEELFSIIQLFQDIFNVCFEIPIFVLLISVLVFMVTFSLILYIVRGVKY